MLVVMDAHATEEQVRAVCKRIEAAGMKAHPMPGASRTAIGITGNNGPVDLGTLEAMPGVVECIPVSKPYKLVSLDVKQDESVIVIPAPAGRVKFGGGFVGMVAGPCAIESREQAFAIAKGIAATGVRLFRGGAYKPRTSPRVFRGLANRDCKFLRRFATNLALGLSPRLSTTKASIS